MLTVQQPRLEMEMYSSMAAPVSQSVGAPVCLLWRGPWEPAEAPSLPVGAPSVSVTPLVAVVRVSSGHGRILKSVEEKSDASEICLQRPKAEFIVY